MDLFTLVFWLGISTIIGSTSVFLYREVAKNQRTEYKGSLSKSGAQVADVTSLFDMVPFIMGEMNKIGDEQMAILMKTYNMTEEDARKVIQPLKKRYDFIKKAEETKGLSMPLIKISGGMLEKFLNNLIKP